LVDIAVALQRIRQASLLEELREAMRKEPHDASQFLYSVASSHDQPKLPNKLILNLFNGKCANISLL
jgi:hypothetical protein